MYEPDRVRSLQRPQGLPFRIGKLGHVVLNVRDVERSARRSRELDPGFRDSAATRLLGTLYVIAPASLLKHGDSEAGHVDSGDEPTAGFDSGISRCCQPM